MIYLDNAATTLKKPHEAARAMARAVGSLASPGRGGHRYAEAAGELAYSARAEAAALFAVPGPERVVFTMNATHALNIAIMSLASPGSRAVVTPWEHNSVIRPLCAAGAEIITASDKDEEESIRELLSRGADLCVVNHVSNVSGRALDIRSVAKSCSELGVPLVIDASQSAGALEISQEELGAAFICMPGHKGLYGPQGTGLLLVGDVAAKPFIYGGTGSFSMLQTMPEELPDRLEAGTHNMPGIAGLREGLRFIRSVGLNRIKAHEASLTAYAARELEKMRGVSVYLRGKPGSVLSFNINGLTPERAAERFSNAGIALRAGLHCSPCAHRTLGTLPEGTVRLSVSYFTERREIDAFLNAAESIAH